MWRHDVNYAFVSSPYPKSGESVRDLERKLERVDFMPNLALIFLCSDPGSYGKYYSLIKKRWKDCNVVTMPAEGYVDRKSVWMRGVAMVLVDAEHDVAVFRGETSRVCMEISRSGRCDFSLLIYPAFNFSRRTDVISGLIRMKRYEFGYAIGEKSVLSKASKYLEDRFVYPINRMLKASSTVSNASISLNIFPVEIKYGHPVISVNGSRVGRGVVRVSIRDGIRSAYSDTLPERGRSFEETVEILKNESKAFEVMVEKGSLVLGNVNGMPAVEFARKVRGLVEKRRESKIDRDLLTGKFFASSPYAIGFVSDITSGCSLLGILDYPMRLHPSIFDLDVFSDEALFIVEPYKGGWRRRLSRMVDDVGEANLLFIDQNFFLMYRDSVFEILSSPLPGNDFLGVFTSYPSYASSNLNRRFMTEVERGICLNLTSTVAAINFP